MIGPYDLPDDLRYTGLVLSLSTSAMVIPAQRNANVATVFEGGTSGWMADLTFGPADAAVKFRLIPFLNRLRGPAGLMRLKDWDYEYDKTRRVPRLGGKASGSITATGAKDAKNVNLAGVGGSTPHFLSGDRLQINDYVYEVQEDRNAVGTSITGIEIAPRLREDLSADAVVLTGIRFRMRLRDNNQVKRAVSAAGTLQPVTISLIEAVIL